MVVNPVTPGGNVGAKGPKGLINPSSFASPIIRCGNVRVIWKGGAMVVAVIFSKLLKSRDVVGAGGGVGCNVLGGGGSAVGPATMGWGSINGSGGSTGGPGIGGGGTGGGGGGGGSPGGTGGAIGIGGGVLKGLYGTTAPVVVGTIGQWHWQ